jgi:prefoldin subunit 5
LTNEIELLEAKIAALEKRKSEIENLMENPETYQKSGLATTLPYEYSRIQEELQSCYDRWEQAQVELDEVLKTIS